MQRIRNWFRLWKQEVVGLPVTLFLFIAGVFILPNSLEPGSISKFLLAMVFFCGAGLVGWVSLRHVFKFLWDYFDAKPEEDINIEKDFLSCNPYQRVKIAFGVLFIIMFLVTLLCKSTLAQDCKPCVKEKALSMVGIKEATGNNDGKEVEAILATVGLPAGYSWCGALARAVYSFCGIQCPRSGWCPDWFKGANVTYPRKVLPTLYKEKDVFAYLKSLEGNPCGFWYPAKGRIAHMGIITKASIEDVQSVQGNTNAAGSREGNLCALKHCGIDRIYVVNRIL
jgi:hypothetical protein